jgi:hypothetical protein
MAMTMLAIGDSQPHLEQRQDFESIYSQQQQQEHHHHPSVRRETEGTTNHHVREEEDVAHKKTDICLMKRKAILLLSKAHKSESTADTQKAMLLFKALYKAETEQDLASLEVEIRQLLNSKQRQQDEIDKATASKNMEYTESPERFSRFRHTWSRLFHPNAASPTSSSSSIRSNYVTRNQPVAAQNNANATTWRMFSGVVPQRVAVHRVSLLSTRSVGDHGLAGLKESSRGFGRSRQDEKKPASNGLDTHSI